MAMIDENGVVLRNIQEQVQKNKDDILELKQAGEGHEPIPGPTGPTGPQGAQGPEGERGLSIYGTASTLPSPSAYKDGDFFLLNNGSIYKKVNGSWLAQTSLRGPQGVQGEPGSEVTPNPTGSPQDELTSIEIDGVRYRVKGDPQWGDIGGYIADQTDLSERLIKVEEVAEGKCKAYLLSTTQEAPTTDRQLQTLTYYDKDGNRILTMDQFNAYVGYDSVYANSDFSSQTPFIEMENTFIIVERQEGLGGFWVCSSEHDFKPIKTGDIIYTEQTETPDRWFWGPEEFYALETMKVDLSNMAKTNQANTFTQTQTMPSVMFGNDTIKSNTYNDLIISINGTDKYTFTSDNFKGAGADLGHSANKWKDLYLSGSAKLGTAELFTGAYNNFKIKVEGYNVFECYYNNIHCHQNFNIASGKSLKIGNTTLTEDQLIALLELIS